LRALRKVDDTVGRVRAALERRGEIEETLILLVSDHGSAPVHTHMDLALWFRDHGVPTLSHPVLWTRNPRAAVMVAGNGSAMVYARPSIPREGRWSLERLRQPDAFGTESDLVAALAKEPAVAFLVGENGSGGIAVTGRGGEADVWKRDGRIHYAPRRGDVLLLGGPISASEEEWLSRSWDSPYPDAAVQLVDLFRADRTGDLVVVASEGFDLRERFEVPHHRAGHGSLIRSHMQTPLWSSEPLGQQQFRTTDIFPSMLEWLGVPVPQGIDGRLTWRPGKPATRSRHLVSGRTYALV
jgi:hypothetical protein